MNQIDNVELRNSGIKLSNHSNHSS